MTAAVGVLNAGLIFAGKSVLDGSEWNFIHSGGLLFLAALAVGFATSSWPFGLATFGTGGVIIGLTLMISRAQN